jgi:hypothetical protein
MELYRPLSASIYNAHEDLPDDVKKTDTPDATIGLREKHYGGPGDLRREIASAISMLHKVHQGGPGMRVGVLPLPCEVQPSLYLVSSESRRTGSFPRAESADCVFHFAFGRDVIGDIERFHNNRDRGAHVAGGLLCV